MSDANVLLNRAKSALIAHDYTLAAKLYKSVILENPDNLEYKMQLGNLYVKAGKDDQALTVFKQVERADNENLDALVAISGIYRRQKKYEESVAVLEQALVICAEDAKSRAKISYNLGFTYRQMGNYSDAINCFEEVVEENPSDVLANNHLGAIYALQGNHEKAIEAYNRGLKFDANHPILQFNIAKSYECLGESAKALSFYEGALRAKPGWTDAIEAYADLLLSINKVDAADDVVTQALKFNPDDVKMHTAKGNVFNRQSIFEDAEIEFKKALDGDEGYRNALTGLAHSLENQGKVDEAVETIQKAEELNPDDVAIMKQSAHIHISANQLDKAYAKIESLQKITKNDVQTLNLLGQYYICNDEAEKAESCFANIKKAAPEYNDVYRDWGERFIQKGDDKKAEPYLQAAIQKNPNDSVAMVFLGELYEKQNQAGKALQYYKQASNADAFNRRSKAASERIVAGDTTGLSFDTDTTETAAVDFDSLFSGGKISSALDVSEDSSPKAAESVDEFLSEEQEISLAADDTPFIDESEAAEELIVPPAQENSDESFDFDQFGMEQLADTDSGVNDIVSVADFLEKDESVYGSENTGDFEELIDDGAPVDEEDGGEPAFVPLPDGSDAVDDLLADGDANEETSDEGEEEKKPEISEESLDMLEEQIKRAADLAEKANYAAESAWEAASQAADAAQAADDAAKNGDTDADDETFDFGEEPDERANEELDIADEEAEEPIAREAEEIDEEIAEEKPAVDDLAMRRAIDMLPSIIASIEDRSVVYKFRSFLELFKKLREMLDYLPASQRKEYMTSRNRLLLDYVISKLSGKPGLYATTKALVRSGLLHATGEAKPSEKDGIDLVKEVLADLRELSESLEDETLRAVLHKEANDLEQSI